MKSFKNAGLTKREDWNNSGLALVCSLLPLQIQQWCCKACYRLHVWMVNSVTHYFIIEVVKTWKKSSTMNFPSRFMDPLIRGDYPLSMRGLVGNRLPQFTKEQSKLVKGAFDFIGLNYYTANYADNLPPSYGLNNSYTTDSRANLTGESIWVYISILNS